MWEISQHIEACADKLEYELKLKAQSNYNLALDTAVAVVSMLGGKQPPSIQDRYPNLFDAPVEDEHAPQGWEIYKEQMIDFANLHNKNRQKERGENE